VNPLFFLKIFGPLALLAGLWLFWTSSIHSAEKRGEATVQKRWDEREKQLQAVADAALTRAAEEKKSRDETLEKQRTSYETALKELDSRLTSSRDSLRSLRNSAVAGPSRNPAPFDPSSACGAYEGRVRQLELLLREGQFLVIEGGGLVNEGQERVGALTLELSSLQSYITEVVKPK
jgi:hypothetical protein